MKRLDELKWKAFNIEEILPFIQRGKRLKTEDHVVGQTPYVSSSSMLNGVDNFISNTDGVRRFKNCLTLANSGSVGETFYQPYEFVASDHVTKLENPSFNKYVYLFIATIVMRLSEKYGFNREINDSRLSREVIMLPVSEDNNPNYAYMEAYMRHVEQILLKRHKDYLVSVMPSQVPERVSIEGKKWKAFFMNEVFDIKSSVRLTKDDMIAGNRPFIGASDSNNGVTAFVSNTNNSLDCNVLGVNYNGSVVHNFYHPYEAIFSDDVKRLHFRNYKDDKYAYLFVKQVILQQKSKFEYGYKFNGERMKRQQILLPVTNSGEPDYAFMSAYMKRIEYDMRQQYLDYIDNL